MRIGARHVGAARRARAGDTRETSYESPSSAALSDELEAALVAIAAVAFAMEALDNELESAGHVLDHSRFVAPKPTNAGFYLSQRLAQAFNLDAAAASRLESELISLFGLRNDSAHFFAKWRAGTHPHPSGTRTSHELTVYTLETADAAVRLGRDVLAAGAEAERAGQLFGGATDLKRELSGVVDMLDEVMAEEGF
jgi:hypothetical protein